MAKRATSESKLLKTIELNPFTQHLVHGIPLSLDIAGIFFSEARRRFKDGDLNLRQLEEELSEHDKRTSELENSGARTEDSWVGVIQGVGGIEPTFGKVIRDYALARVLLVASAEAYANSVVNCVLGSGSAEQFDKLSPTGKWLFLPSILKIKWKPDLAKAPMQDFAALVSRRNRVIHPKEIRIQGIIGVREFLKRLDVNPKSAEKDLASVRKVIREVSLSWRGSYGPDWLYDEMDEHPPCFIGGTVEAGLRLGRPGEK